MKKTQKKIYDIIREEEDKSFLGEFFDWVMVFLIVLNLLLLVLDTFNMPPGFATVSNVAEIFTAVVFTAEYLLRLWVAPLSYPTLSPAKARIKYVFTFMAVIDFFAVMPFYLPFILPINLRVLRIFRLIRLMRLIKFSRYSDALKTLSEVFKKKAGHLLASLTVMFMLILLASILMYDVEHDAQPQVFENALSGLWWALETVTTVSIAEIQPITPLGRFLGAAIAILGIGVVAVPTGIISAGFVDAVSSEEGVQSTTADEIAKFKSLLDSGAITKDEYEKAKENLL